MAQKRVLLIRLAVLALVAAGLLWVARRQWFPETPIRLVSGALAQRGANGTWLPVGEGETLRPGQTYRTDSREGAYLKIGSGADAELSPQSTLGIAATGPGFFQKAGLQLVLEAGALSYSRGQGEDRPVQIWLQTPSSLSRIGASQFSVFVDENRGTLVLLEIGQIAVEAAGGEVLLAAGQATWVGLGNPPESPFYAFRLAGQVVNLQEEFVTIEGQQVHIPPAWSGQLHPGEFVQFAGRIGPAGSWTADWSASSRPGETELIFTGPLVAMDAQNWQVGDRLIVVDDQAILAGEPRLGDVLQVKIYIDPAGLFQAQQALRLGSRQENGTEAPVPAPAATDSPRLDFNNSGIDYEGCDLEPVFQGTLKNTDTATSGEAADIVLGYLVNSGESYLEAFELEPDTWQSIPAGGEAPFDIRLKLSESWKSAPPGTRLEISIFLLGDLRRAETGPAELTLSLIQACP